MDKGVLAKIVKDMQWVVDNGIKGKPKASHHQAYSNSNQEDELRPLLSPPLAPPPTFKAILNSDPSLPEKPKKNRHHHLSLPVYLKHPLLNLLKSI
jgi:hypothetical protein